MMIEATTENFQIISPKQQKFYEIKSKINDLLEFVKKYLPIIYWLPKYNWRSSFFGDVSSGLNMAVLAIPQGIISFYTLI